MKSGVVLFFSFCVILSCSNQAQDQTHQILTDLVNMELGNDIKPEETTFIYLLQNAECKCSEATLDAINSFDQSLGQLVVVVNNKSHFSLPQLSQSPAKIKLLSINTLISYGFFQDTDVLVKIENNKLTYSNL